MNIIKGAQELVFIDAAVDNHASLLEGVRPGVQAITIPANENGIDVVTDALSAATDVRHIHIISHGEPGKLLLGNAALSLETLQKYVRHIANWTKSLAQGSELLIYGCNVAQGDRGASFIETLSSWLGTHIAAATHRVGHSAMGANWDLDFKTGNISADLAIVPSARLAYQGAFIGNDLYASDSDGNLVVINLDTATALNIATTFPTFAIARDGQSGSIVYIENGQGGGSNQQVNAFNPQSGTITPIGLTGLGAQFLKLAQSQDGRFFGSTNSNVLFVGDASGNGAVTSLGNVVGLPNGSGDADFNPNNPNELFILVTSPGSYQLYTIDVSSVIGLNPPPNPLSATLVGNITDGTVGLSPGDGSGSLAFGPRGNLYVTSNTPNPSLYQIPFTNGSPTVVNGNIAATLIGETVDENGQSIELTDFATLPTAPPPPFPDISVTKTDNLNDIAPGNQTTYTIVVTNTSITGSGFFQIEDVIPNEILNSNYTVTIPPGAGTLNDPNDAIGSGDIDILVANLNGNSSLTITISGQVDPNAALGTVIANTVTAELLSGVDPTPDNNTATDTTTVSSGGGTPPDGGGGTPPDGGGGTPPDGGSGTPPDDAGDDKCALGLEQTVNTSAKFEGTEDSDTLTGLGGNNRIFGLGCSDNVFGGRGNDFLKGNEDRDILKGNQGDDFASGGTGPDRINAGLGDDEAKGGTQNDVIRGRKGDDLIEGNRGRDRLKGDEGNDKALGGSGNDRLFGGFGDDRLRAAGGDDRIQAGQNDDLVFGGAGNDFINGGLGADEVSGKKGDDVARGRRGNDNVKGGQGEDSLRGDAGNDRVAGNRGNDNVTGGQGDDVVRGGIGDDVVFSNQGDDKVLGGAGDDVIRTGLGNDTVKTGYGNDRAVLGRGDDTAKASVGDDVVRGKRGDDKVSGNAGNDIVTGGRGDDKVGGGRDADLVKGNQGDDRINGRGGNDEVRAGLGDDILRGGGGDDVLIGGNGDDVLRGGNGDDILIGDKGDDVLIGGRGADIFVYRQLNEAIDEIRDFGRGGDRIDLSELLSASRFSGTTPLDNVRVQNVSGGSSVVQIDANGPNGGRTWQDLVVLTGVQAADVSDSAFIA